MKSILFILLSIISFSSVSQTLTPKTNTIVIGSNFTEDERIKYSGIEMVNSHKLYSKGIKVSVVGVGLGAIGVTMISKSQSYGGVNYTKHDVGVAATIAGSVISIIGVAHVIESQKHIRNAGLILSGNGVGIVVKL
jgi:hypothetical protein